MDKRNKARKEEKTWGSSRLWRWLQEELEQRRLPGHTYTQLAEK
jgi:hypothetical protein